MSTPRSLGLGRTAAAVQTEADDIRAAVSGLTVPQLLARQVRQRPHDASVHWRREGAWHAWTWWEYGQQVARTAGALRRLGFGPGDRAVLLLHPTPELHVVDSAVLLLGGIPISIYNSSPPAKIAALASHCRASVVVVEAGEMLDRVLEVRAALPAVRHVVAVRPGQGGGHAAGLPAGVLDWQELAGAEPLDLEAESTVARPEDPCTVVYTSGSTGAPKGVVLQHRAVLWNCESYLRRLERGLTGARWISYLPLAHISTRMYAQYLHVYAGLEDVTCANPGEVESVITERPPHLFFAPPRLWEKYLGELRAWVDGLPDPERRRRLAEAMQVGQQAALFELEGRPVPAEVARRRDEVRPSCDELRRHLGFEELLTGATGAAPTTPAMIAAWIGLGVPMFEGYGLSESSGLLCVDPFGYRYGTVGRPMPGVELRVAEDEEVLFRSGSAFAEYLDDPEQTAAARGADGWVHTGDLGRIDEDGYLTLTGRKKELLVTSGGENVSPVAVEFALLAQPLLGQACVVGDGRPTLGALVLLDTQAAPAWATEHGLDGAAADALHLDPQVAAEVGRQIAAANEQLSRPERVTRFRLLPGEWLTDSDELTPTSKLRRGAIAEKYGAEIAEMFDGPPDVPAPPRRTG